MKKLKNWDNRTWLSSKSYISQFNRFLKKKINLNKKDHSYDNKLKKFETFWNNECGEHPSKNHCKICCD